MELAMSLGSNNDIFDLKREDANHDLDDGTQLVTITNRGFDRFHTTAILLLRNPFESLVFAKFDLDGNLESGLLRGPVWETEIRQKTYTWLARTKTWICSATSLHITYFESLILDVKSGLENIMEFLTLKAKNENIDCAINFGVRFFNTFTYLSK